MSVSQLFINQQETQISVCDNFMSVYLTLPQIKVAHGSYKRIIMHEKCGRPDSNGFQLK